MCWKKLTYWMKGGIVGFFIAMFVFALEFGLFGNSVTMGGNPADNFWYYYFIFPVIIILFGVLIGLIYGFFHKKRKTKK